MSLPSTVEFPGVLPILCPICNLTVALEGAKSDEHGRAIHEQCHLLALQLKHETSK